MSNSRQDLIHIEKAIQALKYARSNIHHQKFFRAERNAKHAYHYIKNVFPDLAPVVKKSEHTETDCHNHDCHNNYNFYCCSCHCHPHPLPIHLTSQKFFAKVSGGTPAGNELIVPASSFVDDLGNPVVSFSMAYEYTTLFINGMTQQNGVFTVTPSAVVVKGGAHLDSNDPITIELVIQI